MRQKDTPIPYELQELGLRLEQWRKAHAPRARLPEELWAAAVALAGQEGIYRTAHTLHLDYSRLKRKVEAEPSKRATPAAAPTAPGRRGTAPTAFVEFLAGSIATDCLIEMEGGGGRMRIQRKLTAPEVMSLVREWWTAVTERRGDGLT